MAEYKMSARTLPLDDRWDVIVAGGGPAGCTAAAAAAREGAKTLLIEATGSLGGMGTSGLLPAWCPFSDKEKIVYRGLAEKVLTECKAGMAHVDKKALDWVPIDPERLKRVYDDLVTGAGATVLFGTALAAVETDGSGGVATIILANKGGLRACKAKVYADCTGDADLSAWAGAPFVKGDDKGELQPVTLCFALANVDEYAYSHGPTLGPWDANAVVYRILESGKYPRIADIHMCNNIVGPGTVGFNAGHLWDVDNTDPESVSRAMIEGRKIAAEIRDALAEFHPKAFANSYLVATAPMIGCRETRRIVGDYVLTADDYRARRSFPDEICRNSYPIDIHTSKAERKGAAPKEQFAVAVARSESYGKGETHGIPYRCLTPKGLRNVVVAGRSISCDRIVQGSVRVMPVCLAMGEAAGMAAAHAASGAGGDVRAINVARLRKRLIEEGAYLPETKQDSDSQGTAPAKSLR